MPSLLARRTAVVVKAEQQTRQPVPRRAVLGGMLAGAAALATLPVQARDFKEALAAKEARRDKLRQTAGGIKETGKDQQIFKESDYAVSEEARTPNIHSRQGEGAKQQVNV